MINSLTINNFKLYRSDVILPLSGINLFTGINGKGKSTALQPFLLFGQSVISNRATSKIILNGSNVKLGTLDDVKNKESLFSEEIRFKFDYENFNIEYYLFRATSDATDLDILSITVLGTRKDESSFNFKILKFIDQVFEIQNLEKRNKISKNNVSKVTPSLTSLYDLFVHSPGYDDAIGHDDFISIKAALNIINIHYVSADRLGPKNYYESQTLAHFVSVGALGENTVNVLHQRGSDQINIDLFKAYCKLFNVLEDETSITVEAHTNFWIGKIFQGAEVRIESIKGENLLKLRIKSGDGSSYFKPTNVGYGFSYSLPIIVAGLIAQPGEILIVENPEAHLHPYAQSILAKFLSLVSSTGVQVFIESHSEHILNGLRVCVKDNLISCSDLNVLYFDNKEEAPFEKIEVDEDGGISYWPEQFFDQATKDLNHLFEL